MLCCCLVVLLLCRYAGVLRRCAVGVLCCVVAFGVSVC